MKKIENIIDNCKDCRYCKQFNDKENGMTAYICHKTSPEKLLITIDKTSNNVGIPSWCPLETYTDNSETTINHSDPKTVILNNLEWMTENLSGHGGTEINGNWYYTWKEAIKVAEEVGNGWRLPTKDEYISLCNLGSTWDDERKGRWLGPNKELFLPAVGYYTEGHIEEYPNGGYWNIPAHSINDNIGYLGINPDGICPVSSSYRTGGFSIRFVRDINN